MSVNGDQTWTAQALCADIPPDQFFVQGAAQREVRSICFGCLVRIECLADALDSRASFEAWGGLTERKRRTTLRNYPEVKSWERWLCEADDTLTEELHTRHAPHVLVHIRTSKRATVVKIGQSTDMTRREYLTAPLLAHNTKQILDQFGQDDWELVAIMSGPGGSDSLVGYFKHPLQGSVSRGASVNFQHLVKTYPPGSRQSQVGQP